MQELFLIIDCTSGMCDAIATRQGVIDFARVSVDTWTDNDDPKELSDEIKKCYAALDKSDIESAKEILKTDNFSTSFIPDNMNVVFNNKTELFSFVVKDYDCKDYELMIDPSNFITEGTYKKIF